MCLAALGIGGSKCGENRLRLGMGEPEAEYIEAMPKGSVTKW